MQPDPSLSKSSKSEEKASSSSTGDRGDAPSVAFERSPNGKEKETETHLARRVRISIERTWEEASKLTETILDSLIVPSSGFAATCVAWLTTLLFFCASLVVALVLGLGALVLFVGFEFLALIAYAYPGVLLLVSVAGGVLPPLILYWGIHTVFGIDGSWTSWGFAPLLLTGLWGSYYYWRFARVIAATGTSTLDFYRNAAPKAQEIFGAPFLVLAAVWDGVKLMLGIFRTVTGQLLKLFGRKKPSASNGTPPK